MALRILVGMAMLGVVIHALRHPADAQELFTVSIGVLVILILAWRAFRALVPKRTR